jgi:hypothetical protein
MKDYSYIKSVMDVAGKTITKYDISNTRDANEFVEKLIWADLDGLKSTTKMLTVVVVTGNVMREDFLTELKSQRHKDAINKSEKLAIVGMNVVQRIILNSVRLFTGGTVEAFNSESEAIRWLCKEVV